MRCDEVEHAVMQRVTGELATAESQRLTAHLETCVSCREAVESQLVVSTVLANRPRATAPLGFETRVMANLDRSPGWLEVINWQRWTVRLAPVTGILLVVAVVGLGSVGPAEPLEFADLVTGWVGEEEDGRATTFSVLWQEDVTDDLLLEAVLTAVP